jgi:hypothetical protein
LLARRHGSTERVSSSDAPTGGPKSPHGNAAAGRGGRRTVGGFDSPGGEELGGLRDGEREERRDERVVHQARCRGGRLHLKAPLHCSPPTVRRSTLPVPDAEDANPPRGINRESARERVVV